MPKYICIDVGGTFTDAAVLSDNGEINIFKSPTTHNDYCEGIINVLKISAGYYKEDISSFMQSCSLINDGSLTHGSTIATNAILEKKVDKVGLIVTKGHRDVLLWREGPIKNPFDYQIDYPEPFVPRHLTVPVTERINAEGEIDQPLIIDEVKSAINYLKKHNVGAVAVCLLFSILNNSHEERIKKILNSEWPELKIVVLSSEVNPCIREYRRWVAAAMDASLRKLVSNYLKDLNQKLTNIGFVGEIGVLNSSGGIISANEISERPLLSIDSGPALAPICAREIVNDELEEGNIIVMDMGGTSFDVSCVKNNEIVISRESIIGNEIPGIPRVDIHSIGAGGGSIAWVDSGGMIRVGPQSAGSMPGPACYDRGGKQPTVTDANLVLGRLNPDNFNAGYMKLNQNNAKKAIEEHISKPLQLSVEEAASAIIYTVNANMIAAIKVITVERGIDPREFVLFCGGGAGSLHAISLADGLNINKILIPKVAGAISATGGLYSNVVSEFSISYYTESRNFNFEKVNELLSELYDKADVFLKRQGIDKYSRKYHLYIEGRYPNQVWEIPVRIDNLLLNRKIDNNTLKKIVNKFNDEHEKLYSIKEDTYIECIAWRITAIGSRKELSNKEIIRASVKTNESAEHAAKYSNRKVFFKAFAGMVDTPVYDGLKLKFGHEITGPAIIEEPTTTILLRHNYHLRVTPFNNYFIRKIN